MWRATWSVFCRAHGLPRRDDPRRAMRSQGLPTPDIVVFETARARWVALDNAIHHACSPSDDAFGTASRRMGRWEQAKVGTYTGNAAWCAQPDPPVVLPLVGSTFGAIGRRAWAFFDSVVRDGAAPLPAVDDAVAFAGLLPGQRTLLWRRRLSVSLRLAVATSVVGRIQESQAQAARRADSRRGVMGVRAAQQLAWRYADRLSGRRVSSGDAGEEAVGTGFMAR